MQHSHKLVLNSVVSVARIIVNGIVTLLATRIALKALGADDYGVYNLIAGVITLLSFVNGALMISAQRFYSIAIGQNKKQLLNEYFNTSLGLHIFIGIFIAFVFLLLKPWLFSGILNISQNSISDAKSVYDLMVLSSVITIIGVPYSAIINANEDMSVLALSSVVSNVIKLLAAVVLLYINSKLLIVYTGITVCSVAIKLLIEFLWSNTRYDSTSIHFRLFINKEHCKKMIGFIGWNTLGTAGVLVRNQGIAVVLNIFFGTAINAVYGIANQVNSLVLSFASTITTIFTPSIIQAKGEGNVKRMLEVSILSSKLSFFISSLISLPILGFTNEILDLWLTEYPDKTVLFCRYIVISFLVSQLFPGINRAILAVGKIKWYEIFTFFYFIVIIPVSVLLFRLGFQAEVIMFLMVLSHVAILLLTIRYAKKYCGLDARGFLVHSVILPIIIYTIAQFALVWGRSLSSLLTIQLVVTLVSFVSYIVMFWITVLTSAEKLVFRRLVHSYIKR